MYQDTSKEPQVCTDTNTILSALYLFSYLQIAGVYVRLFNQNPKLPTNSVHFLQELLKGIISILNKETETISFMSLHLHCLSLTQLLRKWASSRFTSGNVTQFSGPSTCYLILYVLL